MMLSGNIVWDRCFWLLCTHPDWSMGCSKYYPLFTQLKRFDCKDDDVNIELISRWK